MTAAPAIDSASAPPERVKPRLWLHLLLFVATALTTLPVGLESSLARQLAGDSPVGPGLSFWFDGLSYSVSILAILLAHEMGHYLTAKRHGIDASMPYFIPFPGAFGTLGAFIKLRIREQVPAESLLRMAAWGPIAGFLVALPVLLVGLGLSDVRPALGMGDVEGIALGDSLLLVAAERLVVGELPAGYDVWLHPMAYAGWVGLFVTALNLLPIGQLDGGHIVYCLFGERFNRVMPYLFYGLVAMTVFVFMGWLMLCILLLVIGFQHPPISADTPVQGKAGWIGWITLGLFVLCFSPIPFGGLPTLLELVMP